MNPSKELTLGVVITTYRRVPYLRQCLEAIYSQSRQPDGVWVVVRAEDRATQAYLSALEYPNLTMLEVKASGILHAINRALDEVRTDLLCLIDDDAVAGPDWLSRIEAHFQREQTLGALGGRDILYRDGRPAESGTVTSLGSITPWGEFIGNHHQESLSKAPFPVDYLKSTQLAVRRALLPLRLDTRLVGNCTHFEVDLCLGIKSRGYQVVYDPALQVTHHVDAPYYEDPVFSRSALVRDRWSALFHNRLLVVGKHFRGLFGAWLFLAHLGWVIPGFVMEKFGFWQGLLRMPRLYLSAMVGWWTGRHRLPENVHLLQSPESFMNLPLQSSAQ